MAIDLLNIEPTVVTRDLRNKYILLAADFKYGKTTFMTQIPGALILSFEPGLNARPGVFAAKITKWSELKAILNQLAKEEVKERYSTICFDTITIAAELCIAYVCNDANVKALGDIPYGKLYEVYEREFTQTIRRISMMGYGIVFASHVEEKEVTYRGEKINRIQPKLDKRAFNAVNSLVDIIGIGIIEYDDDLTPHRYLYTGKSPFLMAGSRFDHLPEKIPFGYQEVTEALAQAIETAGTVENGKYIIDEEVREEGPDLDSFEKIQETARILWGRAIDKDEKNRDTIMNMVEEIFGTPKKLSEITEDEKEGFLKLVSWMSNLYS